ncbi:MULTISPECIES: hypothetical protein [unclassified Moraxella]|uniref:hypothetical protein n=1 Tax=unclassified Moraxella TaxID=2685852 RepID=UPI00359D3D57
MSFNIAVFGGSKGLGEKLSEYFISQNFTVYNFSRTTSNLDGVINCNCDVRFQDNIDAALDSLDKKFNMIIYCPSLWRDQESLNTQELINFIETGPLGFKRVCDTLILNNLIVPNANIINIGSIASESILKSKHFSYAISKKLQEILANRIQIDHSLDLKITNIQLGTIGMHSVEIQDVFNIISLLINLSKFAIVPNVTLQSTREL